MVDDIHPSVVVFDLDGTLNLNPAHWRGQEIDGGTVPNIPMIEVARGLFKTSVLIIATCRPERFRQITEDWLDNHEVPASGLLMRGNDDTRSDWLVKQGMCDQIGVDHIKLVFEDRASCVRMWRAQGVQCCQVVDRQ